MPTCFLGDQRVCVAGRIGFVPKMDVSGPGKRASSNRMSGFAAGRAHVPGP